MMRLEVSMHIVEFDGTRKRSPDGIEASDKAIEVDVEVQR